MNRKLPDKLERVVRAVVSLNARPESVVRAVAQDIAAKGEDCLEELSLLSYLVGQLPPARRLSLVPGGAP